MGPAEPSWGSQPQVGASEVNPWGCAQGRRQAGSRRCRFESSFLCLCLQTWAEPQFAGNGHTMESTPPGILKIPKM